MHGIIDLSRMHLHTLISFLFSPHASSCTAMIEYAQHHRYPPKMVMRKVIPLRRSGVAMNRGNRETDVDGDVGAFLFWVCFSRTFIRRTPECVLAPAKMVSQPHISSKVPAGKAPPSQPDKTTENPQPFENLRKTAFSRNLRANINNKVSHTISTLWF